MNTFKQDLNRGIKIEQQVWMLLQRKYPCATIVTAFKGYDIWIPEIHKSVEVKYDPMSNQTGNIVIEIWIYNKPSALLTTTADFWVFYDDNQFISIAPKKIIECIMVNDIRLKRFIGKGDTVEKKAYLVPKELLFSYGNVL
jgi:hypothetical protein